MTIVTRTGDKGVTGLFGGKRVSKSSPRLHAYGTVDELNAFVGAVLTEEIPPEIQEQLLRVQHILFTVGTDLATPWEREAPMVKRIGTEHIREVEVWITTLENSLPPLTKFILPGGSRPGALLHAARTVCRRAERWIVTLTLHEKVNPRVQEFVNRLGDYLFLAARDVNRHADIPEVKA